MAEPARRAWLGLGGNLGDRAGLIARALARLDAAQGIRIVVCSRLYRSPPWGDTDQGEFLNAVAEVATTLEPHRLLDACMRIEDALGRTRTRRWGPRTIDVDVLHMEGIASTDPTLVLPHPLWRERAFVLVPWAEIAPDLVIGGARVAEALARVDASAIRLADA